MRKNRWIAPVWGMLAAAAFGQTASAQVPASPLDGPFPPAGYPAAPGPTSYAGHPTYTPIAPDAASPAGYPPSMEPWPTISPYEHAVDTTYNDRGIWFREMLNHKRKYKIQAEFISGRFRQPGNAIVGHDVVKGLNNPDRDFNELDGGNSLLVAPQSFVGVKEFLGRQAQGRYYIDAPADDIPANFGAPARQAVSLTEIFVGPIDGSGDNGFPVDWTFSDYVTGLAPVVNLDGSESIDDDELSDTNLYVVSGGVLAEDATPRLGGFDDVVGQRRENSASPGLRMVFGLEDEDQSGVDWTGWWLSGDDNLFRRGFDDPRRPRTNGIILFDLGQAQDEFGHFFDTVEVLDYNQLFEMRHTTEAAGTDLAFYHTPMVDFGWLVMRPLYGARYNYVREQFGFTGRDNGRFVIYNQDGSPNNISDTAFAFDDPEILYSLFPYETSVTSKVQSHLYGPQIGLDMKMGGEHLMITSAAKTGIVANTEKLSLGAYGFGSQEAITGQRAFFSDSKTHTRVAPFVEFNANAEINVFPIIPVVNRWHFLKNARLNAGWSALVVGNMQRPMDQIVWRHESAGGPYIKEKGRDAWYMQYWNLGVHWNF